MLLSQTRKRQLFLFTAVVYGMTAYSVYEATITSISFLQTIVKLTEGFNVIIISVFTILNSAYLWRLSTLGLFGNIRLIEYEHILERLPFTLINTILMSSMFKEQDFFTVVLFGSLLVYMKVFHWILRDRLDGLLQNIQETTKLFSLILTRFTLNMVILFVVDYQIVSYSFRNALSDNFGSSTSVLLMVGMEFVMLLVDLLNLFLHSSLSFYEFYQSQGSTNLPTAVDEDEDEDDDDNQFSGLEGKFLYERVIDILTRFLKTVVHCLMLIPLKMPVMLIKDIVWDCITLYQSITAVWKTWRNNKQLDDKLPTVTEEEIRHLEIDNICIICMDELIAKPNSQRSHLAKYKAKRLPCGHVLHLCCLKNWMERSQTCPICRLPVFDENGVVLPSHVTTPRTTTDTSSNSSRGTGTDTNGRANVAVSAQAGVNGSVQHAPTPTVPIAEDVPPQQRQTAGNTWYTFPIEGSSENSISFTLKDTETDRQVPVKLVIDKNDHMDLNELQGDKKYELIQKVIMPNEYINHTQNIDTLKRRISELESQVEDLSKRVRKD